MPSDDLVLGFDTSAAHCAAALLSGDRLIAHRTDMMARGQAERLFPLLEEVLAEGGAGWQDLSALGVGIGPGNFTGIRISVSAARGLALSLNIPAVGVSALAAAAYGHDRPVTAMIDARRDRVYVQEFPSGAPRLIEIADFVPTSPITGPGVDLLAGGEMRPQICDIAEATARIAAVRCNGDVTAPAPLYIRAADAAPSRDRPPVMLDDT